MNPNTELNTFSARQAAQLTGLPVMQIAQIGQSIRPNRPANGKGYRIGYSFRNIVEIRIFDMLTRFGVPRKRIQGYLDALVGSRLGWLEEGGHSGWIVLDNEWRWAAAYSPNEALENLSSLGGLYAAVTLDVGKIKEEIRQNITEVGGFNGFGKLDATRGSAVCGRIEAREGTGEEEGRSANP